MIDENVANELKDKYGEVYRFELEDEYGEYSIKEFIFSKPTRLHLSRFAKNIAADTYKALHTLIMDCLLYPDKAAVQAQIDEKPGLVVSLGSELQRIVGINENFTVSKL